MAASTIAFSSMIEGFEKEAINEAKCDALLKDKFSEFDRRQLKELAEGMISDVLEQKRTTDEMLNRLFR
jgi:hypothetical protein